jgi:hypothetical protein
MKGRNIKIKNEQRSAYQNEKTHPNGWDADIPRPSPSIGFYRIRLQLRTHTSFLFYGRSVTNFYHFIQKKKKKDKIQQLTNKKGGCTTQICERPLNFTEHRHRKLNFEFIKRNNDEWFNWNGNHPRNG